MEGDAMVPAWRAGLLLLMVCQPVAARQPDVVEAFVAGYRYAVPRTFFPDPAETPPQGAAVSRVLSVEFLWPGTVPVPRGHRRSYASGLVALLVQDISPETRVEQLAAVPGQRARFLRLWRDSTVDQFGLATDFDPAALSLADTAEASRLGLRSLGPLAASDPARAQSLFSDGPLAELSVLMMCEAGLSCQLWWMQDSAAVEATFDERFLPDWMAIRQSVAALLGNWRGRPRSNP